MFRLAEQFDNLVQPFLVDKTHMHGRFARLNGVASTILAQHDYPEQVSALLGEQLVLTALLSRALKHEGIITIQIKGDGAVRLMVTDVTAEGVLRGYADIDTEKAAQQLTRHPDENRDPVWIPASAGVTISDKSGVRGKAAQLTDIFGAGYMAITVEHGFGNMPYQGIVELTGSSLTECCLHYLTQSEQFKVTIKTTVARLKSGGWEAGGILVQRLPEDEKSHQIILPKPMEHDGEIHPESKEEEWNRTRIFVDSLKDEEILERSIAPREILYRLFHDDGVWVYEAAALKHGCRCSRERIEGILNSMPATELDEMRVDGKITVTCQFCNKNEIF